ncbi:hypothetical protein N7457_007183 [Penicillium paradoxum]|uniref:uncharacterized protein n=1 Tax=Penicillium paradoxum TaxID=176176 RepID=UPI002548187F|nr:uncharacterized protein N7457_007183 [Penicillium paradoxum]KAJ5779463.1 hypothetical protein N7457_007183 [Penicillium paradoxum]
MSDETLNIAALQSLVSSIDNTVDRSLRVPEFNAIPVDSELDINKRFANGALGHLGTRRCILHVTNPEVVILRLVENVSDKSNWECDVFDEKVVMQEHGEAMLDSQLGNDLCFEWDIDFDMDLVSATMGSYHVELMHSAAA